MKRLRWRALAVLVALAPGIVSARAALPVINSFTSTRGAVGSTAPWQTDFLQWSVTGATSLSIDNGVGTVTANGLTPNSVPNVITERHLADGIGDVTITGVGVPNLCRYNLGGGTVIDGALGVFDHEIGHNWAARLGSEVANGHWYANGTVHGQMADNYFVVNNGVLTAQQINGSPAEGFTWTGVDPITVAHITEIRAAIIAIW